LDNTGQGALDPEAVFALGLAADHPDADAIVLSCTEMRSVEAIARLENEVGKPVISSNQAMAFQALQLAGIGDAVAGFGQLLERVRL
jgi:maleate cis-trans isomerase